MVLLSRVEAVSARHAVVLLPAVGDVVRLAGGVSSPSVQLGAAGKVDGLS
jgi:hypothetical protein